ncbi:hypothetical protein CO613_08865 [Lysobacteraceae bacterium NML07-0707]|nr:hypothetical protein CO613_08865 [Xanthomonadaceae bacterium NML07-0707]
MRPHLLTCALFGALASIPPVPALAADSPTEPSARQASEQLDRVVVTATRNAGNAQQIAASVSVQDKQALDRKGFYAGGDEFRGVPGVFFRRGQGDNEDILSINFRGIIGTHGNDTFLALFDGLSFLSPDDELLMQELPYAAVDRVEIVRGPVSALYGRGGLAGAVNYISIDPESDASHVSLRLGSENYRRGQVLFTRAGENRSGLVLSATHERADGWRDNNARESTQLFAKGILPLGEHLQLTLYGSYLDKQYQTGGGMPTLADGRLYPLHGGRKAYYGLPGSGQEVRAWFGVARLSWQMSEHLNLTTTLMHRHRDSQARLSFYDPWLFDADNHVLGVNGFHNDSRTPTRFLESTLNWRGERHQLTAGASLELARPKSRDSWSGQNGFSDECGFTWYANLFDTRSGAWINRDHPCQSFDLRNHSHSRTEFRALFVQDEIELNDHWRLTLGARHDSFRRSVRQLPSDVVASERSEQQRDQHVSPKAALAYRFGNSQLYAAYGQGYSSNFGPIWRWDPAAYRRDTLPSTLESIELGYKGSLLGQRLQLAAAVFQMQQKNRVFSVDNPEAQHDPMQPGTLILSGPPLQSRGAELSLRTRLGDDTRLDFSASWVDAKWRASDFYARHPSLPNLAGRTPVGVPETMWNLGLEQRFSDWLSGHIGYEWYDDYFISLDNMRKGGGHGLGNMSLTLTPPAIPRLTAALVVSNLFDRNYHYLYGNARDVTLAVPGVPRQLWLNLRYDF